MIKQSEERIKILKQFRTITGVGKTCSLDFWNIGLRSNNDIARQNPGVLYDRLNTIIRTKHDLRMLYTFRCAIYSAVEKDQDNEKLKQWYWKDKFYKGQET
jgi:hypothetical protein